MCDGVATMLVFQAWRPGKNLGWISTQGHKKLGGKGSPNTGTSKW